MFAKAFPQQFARLPASGRWLEWQIAILAAFAGGSLIAAALNLGALGVVGLVRRQPRRRCGGRPPIAGSL